MRTDLSPDTDVSLLPRADLPVIWDAFKAKADAVRATAETLTVTCITQKDEMALARTTRLTLREIRIAVENKRVELGESHLKEIKKVNGAANAIKEFILPLEHRLLVQEEFGERAEAARIAELSKSRLVELQALRVCLYPTDLGTMKQADYDNYVARLRSEHAEIEAANQLRIEAERRLAEQAIEMRRQEEEFLARLQAEKVAENARLAAQRAEWEEQDRQRAAAAHAALELAQRVALEEKKKNDAEALRIEQAVRAEAAKLMLAQQVEAKAELDRANAIAEAKALETRRLTEAAQSLRIVEQARLDAEKAVRDADLAEQKRIRDEQYAVLEAELAQANAAKQKEADAARRLALAPDVDKLRAFSARLLAIEEPGDLTTPEALAVRLKAVAHLAAAVFVIDVFCGE